MAQPPTTPSTTSLALDAASETSSYSQRGVTTHSIPSEFILPSAPLSDKVSVASQRPPSKHSRATAGGGRLGGGVLTGVNAPYNSTWGRGSIETNPFHMPSGSSGYQTGLFLPAQSSQFGSYFSATSPWPGFQQHVVGASGPQWMPPTYIGAPMQGGTHYANWYNPSASQYNPTMSQFVPGSQHSGFAYINPVSAEAADPGLVAILDPLRVILLNYQEALTTDRREPHTWIQPALYTWYTVTIEQSPMQNPQGVESLKRPPRTVWEQKKQNLATSDKKASGSASVAAAARSILQDLLDNPKEESISLEGVPEAYLKIGSGKILNSRLFIQTSDNTRGKNVTSTEISVCWIRCTY